MIIEMVIRNLQRKKSEILLYENIRVKKYSKIKMRV